MVPVRWVVGWLETFAYKRFVPDPTATACTLLSGDVSADQPGLFQLRPTRGSFVASPAIQPAKYDLQRPLASNGGMKRHHGSSERERNGKRGFLPSSQRYIGRQGGYCAARCATGACTDTTAALRGPDAWRIQMRMEGQL